MAVVPIVDRPVGSGIRWLDGSSLGLRCCPGAPGGRSLCGRFDGPGWMEVITVPRQVQTLLFTDIVGSTDRLQDLGDAAWAALLARHHGVIRGVLAAHGGREVNTTFPVATTSCWSKTSTCSAMSCISSQSICTGELAVPLASNRINQGLGTSTIRAAPMTSPETSAGQIARKYVRAKSSPEVREKPGGAGLSPVTIELPRAWVEATVGIFNE